MSNLEEIMERVKAIRQKHPQKRAEAVKELQPILEALTNLKFQLEDFEAKWFLDSNRVITEIGKVGREVDLMFVLSHIEYAKALIGRILESLKVKT